MLYVYMYVYLYVAIVLLFSARLGVKFLELNYGPTFYKKNNKQKFTVYPNSRYI